MYVCLCYGVTDTQIREAVSEGCCSFREVRNALKVASQCGKCACTAKTLVREALDGSCELAATAISSDCAACPSAA